MELEELAKDPEVQERRKLPRRSAGKPVGRDLREGRLEQQATLVRQARRKFGSETAEELAALLEGAGGAIYLI